MKQYWLSFILIVILPVKAMAAVNLMEVYRQALLSDQIFQQAISQRLYTKEGVPISLSNLLPALNALAIPQITKTNTSGRSNFTGDNDVKGYAINVTLTQTVFNFSQFANLSQALSLSKQADATLNAAVQSLMVRVANAYFAVLQDEDNLRYIGANKKAFAEQLNQVTQQFQVGLKTITDVYTAQASYDSSAATFIAAQATLANDKENLRVITGVYYPTLYKLSQKFPLVKPNPANAEEWVLNAQKQNWSIKAAQYAANAARDNVKQQFGGHIPSVQLQGIYNVGSLRTIADQPVVSVIPVGGTSNTTSYGASLNITVPIVQGGLVVANTRQAQYNYQIAFHQLDQQVRNTINLTRQSYLNVMAGISKIEADINNVRSTISSLEGLRAAYEIGTGTLVDVVTQQRLVFQAESQYAADRYSYVNNLLALKAAAGTLNYKDLKAIDYWLVNEKEEVGYEFAPANPSSIMKSRNVTIKGYTNSN